MRVALVTNFCPHASAALSRCHVLVTSRSAFSWWAARLATEHGARLTFPSSWWDAHHRGGEAAAPASWVSAPAASERGPEQ